MEQHRDVPRREAEHARDVLARDVVEEAQADDRALELRERVEAADRDREGLGPGDDLVGGRALVGDGLDGLAAPVRAQADVAAAEWSPTT